MKTELILKYTFNDTKIEDVERFARELIESIPAKPDEYEIKLKKKFKL